MDQKTVQRLLAVAATALSCLLLLPAGAGAAKPNCTLKANKRAVNGPDLKPTTLSLKEQSDQILNFGDDRGVKVDYVTLTVSPRLPKEVKPKHLELNSLVPMKRIGADNLESTRLKFPSFIPPRIHSHGERISFGICIDAAGGDPGTYNGQVEITGPKGLSSLQLTQTAQLKAPVIGLFGLLFLLALGVAFVFIWRRVGEETNAPDKKGKVQAQLLVIAISLGAAGYAMWKIYNDNPAWGADWFTSLAALVATGFAATGIGQVVVTGAGVITGKGSTNSTGTATGAEPRGERAEKGSGTTGDGETTAPKKAGANPSATPPPKPSSRSLLRRLGF